MKNNLLLQIISAIKPQPELQKEDNPVADFFQLFLYLGPIIAIALSVFGIHIPAIILHFFVVYHTVFPLKEGAVLTYDWLKAKHMPIAISAPRVAKIIFSLLIVAFYFSPAGMIALQWFGIHTSILVEGSVHALHTIQNTVKGLILLLQKFL